MFEYDELKLYKGNAKTYVGYSVPINNKISIYQPTLSEIADFGEKEYFNAVYTLTSVPADLKWQLWDIGIDYTKVDDYELFIFFTSQLLSSQKNIYSEWISNPEKYEDKLISLSEQDIADMETNPLCLVLKDIDIADFTIVKKTYNNDIQQYVLMDCKKGIVIDRYVYTKIVEFVRKIHGLKRNNETPANERTKMDLIEDARDEAMLSKNKPYKSFLKPLISTMKVKCGQCGDERIWNQDIGQFLYDIKRIGHAQNAELLLSGAYSGFGSLKGVDQNRLDIFADI